ncbi:MAG: hypothetical protein ACI9HK_001285 [Pirellulaceae bacterium]|jgi:hypothetical protein
MSRKNAFRSRKTFARHNFRAGAAARHENKHQNKQVIHPFSCGEMRKTGKVADNVHFLVFTNQTGRQDQYWLRPVRSKSQPNVEHTAKQLDTPFVEEHATYFLKTAFAAFASR